MKKIKDLKQKVIPKIRSSVVNVLLGDDIDSLVSQNVMNFLTQCAKEENSPIQELFVIIKERNSSLKVTLHHGAKQLRSLSINELITFFAGEEIATSPGIKSQITQKVLDFLKEFSESKKITDERLQIVILNVDRKPLVRAYEHTKFLTTIPVSELIKKFI